MAAYLEWERQDFAEAVEGIDRGYNDLRAGAPDLPRSFSPTCAASMTFRVEITAEAEQDADAILALLMSEQTGKTGQRWVAALDDAIGSLAQFPARCPLAPENSAFPFEVRHLLYGRKPHVYRILFTIEDQTVYILHIRHGRRQPLKP